MSNFLHRFSLLWLACLLPVCKVWSAPPPFSPPTSQTQQWAWMLEKWKSNSYPFSQLQKAIEAELGDTKPNQAKKVLEVHAKSFASKPQSSIELFRYAAALYLCSKYEGQSSSHRELFLVSQRFASVQSPGNYYYSRIRFLITLKTFPHPNLRRLAQRLLLRNPKDVDVLYQSLPLFDASQPDQKRQVFANLNTLRRLKPQSPALDSAEGGIYYRAWLSSKQPSDARMALAAYNRFLQIAPADEPFRAQAQRLIQQLQGVV